MRIRFRDLTDEERDIICNGCGPKGFPIPVPNFLFKASCDHHDFNYWLGCKRVHRLKADLQFYREMLKDAAGRRFYVFWATIYFWAVRLFGWCCFHWASKQRDSFDVADRMNWINSLNETMEDGDEF